MPYGLIEEDKQLMEAKIANMKEKEWQLYQRWVLKFSRAMMSNDVDMMSAARYNVPQHWLYIISEIVPRYFGR